MLNVVLTIRAENVADTFAAHWALRTRRASFGRSIQLRQYFRNNSTVGDSFFLRSTITYYT